MKVHPFYLRQEEDGHDFPGRALSRAHRGRAPAVHSLPEDATRDAPYCNHVTGCDTPRVDECSSLKSTHDPIVSRLRSLSTI